MDLMSLEYLLDDVFARPVRLSDESLTAPAETGTGPDGTAWQ